MASDQSKKKPKKEIVEFGELELSDGDAPIEEGDGVPTYAREFTANELETYIDDIADTVRVGLDQSISILTPWFFNNMPQIYYQTTPRQEKVRHLSSIITGHVFETKQTVELWERDKSKVTYIGPGGDRKILTHMASKVSGFNLKLGAIYFSRDRLLFLSTFNCTAYKKLDDNNLRIKEKIKDAKELMLEEFPESEDSINHYLENMDNDLVMYATASRLFFTYRMVRHMIEHQGAHTFLDTLENSPRARLTIGLKNVKAEELLEPVLGLLDRYDFNVGRVFLAQFEEGYKDKITVMHFIISHASGEKIAKNFLPVLQLTKAVRTLGWVDHDDFSIFHRTPFDYSLNATNLIRAMANWCHIFLSKRNPYAYSLYKIKNTFSQYNELLRLIVESFRVKFDPARRDIWEQEYESYMEQIEQHLENVVEDIDRAIFKKCIIFVRECLKTNYFMSTKTGLAFRFAPNVLENKYYPDSPFGIFYIIGKDFRFFHVRWRDIARGGMRVVMPRTSADYDMALAGMFDEVYGLSHAQQLKNKDIPEGGSKAVLVLSPGGHRDQAVKGSVNALLDLLVEKDETKEDSSTALVSYYDKTEIIYLGPDENMTNDLITWIPAQAERRGYKYAAAFMSSKPGEGINHKEFGVTSEGVNVYVDNTLRFLGVNPKEDKFTVKITGGPDGDVAGNELLILNREYGENARVVSVSDGFGVATDPEGLDWSELLKLVRESKSIVHFDKAKLSKNDKAFVIAADTNPNIRIRNEIYFKVYADIFIPAGGRPYSVNNKNWVGFFNEQDEPSVKAIVEGANIFFTKQAREELQQRGVYSIKDSSANKTGVICSSYEIIGSLLLSKNEFLEMKEEYVKEVVSILREKADAEAKLLFRTYALESGNKTLVDLSLEVSKEINHMTDVLLSTLAEDQEAVLADPFYQDIVVRHCPKILQDRYRERILERLPEAHMIAIISSYVASYVIYNEGLGWLNRMPRKHWAEALKIYMEKDRLARDLEETISSSKLDSKDDIKAIISLSAARNLTLMELQKRNLLS